MKSRYSRLNIKVDGKATKTLRAEMGKARGTGKPELFNRGRKYPWEEVPTWGPHIRKWMEDHGQKAVPLRK
jgi:hypothetical protein